jgi:hypothetical protein
VVSTVASTNQSLVIPINAASPASLCAVRLRASTQFLCAHAQPNSFSGKKAAPTPLKNKQIAAMANGWPFAFPPGMKRTTILLLLLLLTLAVSLGVMRIGAAPTGLGISPEIVGFTASPQAITRGQSATLTWNTRATASVTMEWGPENRDRGSMQKKVGLPSSGTMVVQPEENTIYILECETRFGDMCMSASTTVRVK